MDIMGSWEDAARSIISGLLVYVALVCMLRVSGKRTVAKWNAFDLIVTVALGSAVGSAIVSRSVSVLSGLGAFVVLIGLQLVITWLSVRAPVVQRMVKSSPALLVRDGEFVRDRMGRERVTEAEVLTAVRGQGYGDLHDVHAVVLETDGTFSVIGRTAGAPRFSTLQHVEGYGTVVSR